MELAQMQGHHVVENAIISDVAHFPDIIKKLKVVGYAVEGEFTMELTEEGKAARQKVKIRPSEGQLQKLSGLMSLLI